MRDGEGPDSYESDHDASEHANQCALRRFQTMFNQHHHTRVDPDYVADDGSGYEEEAPQVIDALRFDLTRLLPWLRAQAVGT